MNQQTISFPNLPPITYSLETAQQPHLCRWENAADYLNWTREAGDSVIPEIAESRYEKNWIKWKST